MIEVYKENTWLKEDSMDIVIKIMTFMISPFISFLYSLKRINTRSSFVVFFLFALIYGLCFTVIADNLDVWEHNDAAKWRFRFENTNIYTIMWIFVQNIFCLLEQRFMICILRLCLSLSILFRTITMCFLCLQH